MGDKLPLVVYKDGKRIIVGEAEIVGDYITADITDPVIAERVAKAQLEHLSIGGGEASIIEGVKPKRRNVFDTNKD